VRTHPLPCQENTNKFLFAYYHFIAQSYPTKSSSVDHSLRDVRLTFASSVRHHDRLVLALGASEAVLRLGTFEAVTRAGAAVVVVQHVVVPACLTCHRLVVARVGTRQTVERTL